MDLTLSLLIAAPVIVLAAQLLPRRMLVVAIGYGSTIFSRVALFNALPLFSLLGGIIALLRARRTPHLAGVRPIMYVLVMGGLTALLSTLWSANGLDALATSLRWLALAPLVVVAVNVLQDDGIAGVSKMLGWLSPVVLVQAASTIYFRFNPSSEESYYRSGIARFFLGDAGQALFTDAGWNNVRELERAGGILFVSVNRAALVMGVMCLIYLGCWMSTRRIFPLLIAAVLAAAILFGGSKTGMLLLVILPAFALTAAAVSRRRNAASRMIILLTALVGAIVALQIFVNTADEFVTSSEITLLPRYVLWGEALRAIGENSFTGLGFGGWESRWSSGAVAADFTYRPAHNWFLQAWLDGGVLYVAANVTLVIVVVRQMLVSLSGAPTAREARLVAMSGSAFLWAFIHGTLDNTPIFGDPQASAFLAIAAGLIITVAGTMTGAKGIERETPLSQSNIHSRLSPLRQQD